MCPDGIITTLNLALHKWKCALISSQLKKGNQKFNIKHAPLFVYFTHSGWTSLMAQQIKYPLGMQETQETQVKSLDPGDPLEKELATTPVLLPEKLHGRRSLVGCSLMGGKELDRTAQYRLDTMESPLTPAPLNPPK